MNTKLSHLFSSSTKSQLKSESKSFSKTSPPKCSILLLLLLFGILPIALSQSVRASSHHELRSKDTSKSEPTKIHTPHTEYHIRKPISDPNEYRYITLENGLKVLMISDSTVIKSSAALVLDVGKTSDPPEIPGLAHLLEHVLTLGSKTYGKEVYRKGFYGNARIRNSGTVYYSRSNPLHFEKILDVIADPFINPRFDFEWYQSELPRIDEEFNQKLGKTDLRLFVLLRYLVDPESLLARDTTGNYETLHHTPIKQGINVSQALEDLFEKYHSANLMTLVIIHDRPLDEIQRIVVQSQFSKIPNKNQTKPNLDHFSLPLTDKNRYKILKYTSHTAEGSVIFQICGVESKLGVTTFLRNVFTNPHAGSLSDELFKRNLIYSTIDTDYFVINSDCGLISLEFPLSPLGQYRFGEIVQTVFASIHQLLHEGLTQDLLNEYLHEKKYFFEYSEEPLGGDSNKFKDFALDLLGYSPDDFLSKFRGLSDDVHQTLARAKSILSQMNTHTLMLLRSQTQDQEFDKLKTYDPVTKIGYLITTLPEDLVKKWNTTTRENYPTFRFLEENLYTPKSFDLVPLLASQKPLQIISHGPNRIIWYGSEATPKVALYIRFKNINSLNAAVPTLVLDSLDNLWTEQLAEEKVAIERAGHSFSISIKDIKIEAFSDNLAQIVDSIAKPFHEIINQILMELDDEAEDLVYYPAEPHKEALNLLNEILVNHQCTSALEMQDLARNFEKPKRSNLLKEVMFSNLECLVYGNILPEEAIKMIDKLTLKRPQMKRKLPEKSILNITGHNLIYKVHLLSAQEDQQFILNYYQGSFPATAKNIAFLKIFLFYFEQFNINKLEDSDVQISEFVKGNTLGFVLSWKRSSEDYDFLLKGCLRDFLDTDVSFSQLHSQRIQSISTYLTKRMEARSRLFRNKTNDIFYSIKNQGSNFISPEDILEELKRITVEECREYARDFFDNCGKISLLGFHEDFDLSYYDSINKEKQHVLEKKLVVITSSADLQRLFELTPIYNKINYDL